jgi:hypothetical protein
MREDFASKNALRIKLNLIVKYLYIVICGNLKKRKRKMIYRNIEKLVLNTPNNMELGEKVRELYWKERNELEKEILRLREGTNSFDSVMANVLANGLEFEEGMKKIVDELKVNR